MRGTRHIAWIGGAVGAAGVVAYRFLRRGRAAVEPEPAPDPRADELRRKLDESRAIVDEPEEFDAAETRVDEAEVAQARDLEGSRRRVHERARAAADEMRRQRPG